MSPTYLVAGCWLVILCCLVSELLSSGQPLLLPNSQEKPCNACDIWLLVVKEDIKIHGAWPTLLKHVKVAANYHSSEEPIFPAAVSQLASEIGCGLFFRLCIDGEIPKFLSFSRKAMALQIPVLLCRDILHASAAAHTKLTSRLKRLTSSQSTRQLHLTFCNSVNVCRNMTDWLEHLCRMSWVLPASPSTTAPSILTEQFANNTGTFPSNTLSHGHSCICLHVPLIEHILLYTIFRRASWIPSWAYRHWMQGLTQWQWQCRPGKWCVFRIACVAADVLDTGANWHLWSGQPAGLNPVQMGCGVCHGIYSSLCRQVLPAWKKGSLASWAQEGHKLGSTVIAHVAKS